MNKSVELSIIIPLFNEAENLDILINRIDALVKTMSISVEVILVDDHSNDSSVEIIKDYCKTYEYLKFIKLSKNSGSHIAIIAGFQISTGNAVVFLAGDLQDPPELIQEMLHKWKQNYDVIWAVREFREGISFISKSLSNIFYKLFNFSTDLYIPPKGADFALLDRKVVDALLKSVGTKPSLGALIMWLGFKQTQIAYVKESRKFGKSKWTLAKKINAFTDAFVGFSVLPLRLMSIVGILTSFFGFIYAIILLILKLTSNIGLEGWTSLIVVILVVGGLQMLMLGIIGEYLWRNLEESRKRPLFFIEESLNIEPKQ